MNLPLLVFLIITAAVARSQQHTTFVTLFCAFTPGPFYSIVGNAYQCRVQEATAIKSESTVIESVNGVHQDVNSNTAVTMLWVWGTIFHFVPARVGLHLPRLEAIWIHAGGLKALRFEGLKQFPRLRFLYAGHNQLEALAPDVFRANPGLEWIDLQHNQLKFVDGALFTRFPLLQNVNLKKNYCVDQHHHGRVGHVHFEHLKHDIDMNCHLPNEIFCSSQNVSHQGEILYTCSGKGTAINHRNVTLLRVLHNQNLTLVANPLNETRGLVVRHQNFTHFPRNLHEFLPNLEAIQIIGCGLQELTADDLRHFGELRSLWLPLNRMKALQNEVFASNHKLERLSLYGNQLRLIQASVLVPLQSLRFVSFEKNYCVDVVGEGREIFEKINKEIATNCQ